MGKPGLFSVPGKLFPLLPHLDELCAYEVWGKADDEHTIVRFVTSFATPMESVEGLLAFCKNGAQLLFNAEEITLQLWIGNDQSLSHHGAIFGAADIEGIGESSKIGKG